MNEEFVGSATVPDEFNDPVLRRALDHAPDAAVAPDWRIRKAIQQRAREAVELRDEDILLAPMTPLWKRLLGIRSESGGSGMPWNAVFATVLVGVIATALWQHEPAPEARLGGAAKSSADSSAAPVTPTAKETANTLPPEPVDPTPMPGLEPRSEAPSVATEPMAPTEPTAPTPATPATAPTAKTSQEPTTLAAPTSTPGTPPATAVATPTPLLPTAPQPTPAFSATPKVEASPPAQPSSLPIAVAAPSPGDKSRDSADADRQARGGAPAGSSSGAAAPVLPGAAVTAATPVAAMAKVMPPSTVRTEATDPPTFAALSQWTRLTISQKGGETRSLSRAEGREVLPLIGSAAISAVGAQRFRGGVEWRLTFERDGKVVAVLEVAPDQVRWRENQAPPATGAPSAGALAALERSLAEVIAARTEVPTVAPSIAPVAPPIVLPSEPVDPPASPPTSTAPR